MTICGPVEVASLGAATAIFVACAPAAAMAATAGVIEDVAARENWKRGVLKRFAFIGALVVAAAGLLASFAVPSGIGVVMPVPALVVAGAAVGIQGGLLMSPGAVRGSTSRSARRFD